MYTIIVIIQIWCSYINRKVDMECMKLEEFKKQLLDRKLVKENQILYVRWDRKIMLTRSG